MTTTKYHVIHLFGVVPTKKMVGISSSNSRITSSHVDLKIAALRMARESVDNPGNYTLAVQENDAEFRSLNKVEYDIITSVIASDSSLPSPVKHIDTGEELAHIEMDPVLQELISHAQSVLNHIKTVNLPEIISVPAAKLAGQMQTIEQIKKLHILIDEAKRKQSEASAPLVGMTPPLHDFLQHTVYATETFMKTLLTEHGFTVRDA